MHYIFSQQYRWIPIVSSEHEETRSRVCILSAGIRTSIETKNKLIGWVDSDFESDPDTRKSMTGYFIRVSEWRSYFLEILTITFSNSEAEFVATSQAGHEVVYLSVLLKGFGSAQKKLTQIWENNQACPNLVLLC